MASSFEYAKIQEGFRAHCEDRSEVYLLDDKIIAVVADGVGGQSGGERAAEMVLEEVRAKAPTMSDLMNPETWVQFIEQLDKKIFETEGAGQTTVVIFAATTDKFIGVNCGDSGAWRVGETELEDLTEGTEKELFLGCGRVVSKSFSGAFNGTLLISSDGLYKFAEQDAIMAIVRKEPPKIAASRLFQLVLGNSKGILRGDVALVVARPKSAAASMAEELETPLPV